MNNNEKIKLNTKFCGIEFANPFILASAPPTDTPEKLRRAFSMGWGGAVTKTLKPNKLKVKNVAPRFGVIKNLRNETIGFENFELVDTNELEVWTSQLEDIKKEYPDRLIIGSIMAEINKKDWQDLTVELQNSGIDALELNFSCPHGMPEKGIGHAIGQDPDLTEMITSWVKEVSTVPVIVKLSPNVTDVVAIAKSALAGGADALAAINTVQSLIGVDIDTFEPLPSVGGYTTYGGYSGKAVKPIGLRVVSELAKNTDTEISGMGGISNWKDSVEYMLLGANHVQICTEVMLKGFYIIEELLEGLESYLEEKRFNSVKEITGLTIDRITTHEKLKRDRDISLKIDKKKCVACGKCVVACKDSGKNALDISNNLLHNLKNKCDFCSLCTHICPVDALDII